MALTDAPWRALEPLIEACRPRHRTPHHDLRRTIEGIAWRHQNGTKWRSIPAGASATNSTQRAASSGAKWDGGSPMGLSYSLRPHRAAALRVFSEGAGRLEEVGRLAGAGHGSHH